MSSLSGTHDEPADLADLALEGDAPPGARGLRPDIALLDRAKSGDRAAFGQIVLMYQDRLYNAVLRIVGDRDEALELTQEAFTRGLMKVESFRGDASPYTWLFRIAVNLAISQIRKVQRNRVFSLDGSTSRSAAPTPHQRLVERERDQQVLAALGRLDAEYRAVLVMRDVEGFDYQQMADLLGLPLGTLKSRLFRARLALRDELRPYLNDQKLTRE
jgi:RNA polymerase sigma-70 factor (ECF subfamily)